MIRYPKNMRTISAGLLVFALPASLAAQATTAVPKTPVDWSAMQTEAVGVLQQYLRINTTNPPGNELETARFLKAFLEKEGIEAQIMDTVELGAGRANLYARLKGNGSKKAIALVQHMDVVPVTPAYWTVPAFSGEIKDGFLYGRGALDMKGEGIAHLMALVAIKRSGVPLTRDIVFIANADEELGSTGALVFVDRHADLIRDVEYLFTEGGANVY
ncbi:MAG: M20/M25/M40 family metallo-hydrolase, partial [bacterium]